MDWTIERDEKAAYDAFLKFASDWIAAREPGPYQDAIRRGLCAAARTILANQPEEVK